MAIEGALQSIVGIKASADLSAKQFRCVKYSGVGTVTVVAAITDKVCGILQDTPVSGQAANVAQAGLTKALAGGTVTAGDTVGTDNAGRVVTIVPGTDTTQYVVGKAQTSGAINEVISVLLALSGRAS